LDFVSGRKKRAPKWMQMAGAEWLFRVITEPTRLGRTLKMFKMPYFAARFYKREIELLGKPEESTLRSQTQRNAN
jgi:UDP-N-acetyl-D-mannosaminuronic acid transferase (WecB/TagA/CpsF family)